MKVAGVTEGASHMLGSKKILRGAVATAIVLLAVGLSPHGAGATPMGTTQSQVFANGTAGGSLVNYECIVTDTDPRTVAISLDDCHLENIAHAPVNGSAGPVVAPGNTVASGNVLVTTNFASPYTYYVCWKATSLHEFAPPETRSGCEEWGI
jgi:hypothetical protein